MPAARAAFLLLSPRLHTLPSSLTRPCHICRDTGVIMVTPCVKLMIMVAS